MASMTQNENSAPDGPQAGLASTSDVEEMLRLLPDTQGDMSTDVDPESVQRIKLKVRTLMEGVLKVP